MATIGPASAGRVAELAAAGMDAARLNLSHGTWEEHAAYASLVREAQQVAGRPLALIADLQGPKLRVGDLSAPLRLLPGQEVVVAGEGGAGTADLPIVPPAAAEVLAPGHDVLIDDGHVRLRVERADRGRAVCTVTVGGLVQGHKGVNLPGVPLPIPCLTDKDLADLRFACQLGADYVALSFVRSPDDVRELRRRLEEAGSPAHVIAKIEKAEAVQRVDEIVAAADAVMVARGDLGVEMGPAQVPLLQKRIIQVALQRARPVITATQMLESMLHAPEPTRAEASDVANAVLDGTSALMLSEETAVGAYPVEAVRYMDVIARAVEPSLGHRHELATAGEAGVSEAIANAACDLAEVLAASLLVVTTYTGRMANVVARLRPRRPIAAITHQARVARRLALEWGVVPLVVREGRDVEDLWGLSLEAARAGGLAQPGERVVLTAGTHVNVPGSTNVIKVETL